MWSLKKIFLGFLIMIFPFIIYSEDYVEYANPTYLDCDESSVKELKLQMEIMELSHTNLLLQLHNIDHKINNQSSLLLNGEEFKTIFKHLKDYQQKSFQSGFSKDNFRRVIESISSNLKMLNQTQFNKNNKINSIKNEVFERIENMQQQEDNQLHQSEKANLVKNELVTIFNNLNEKFSSEINEQENQLKIMQNNLMEDIEAEINLMLIENIQNNNQAITNSMEEYINESFKKQQSYLINKINENLQNYEKTTLLTNADITQRTNDFVIETIKTAIEQLSPMCGDNDIESKKFDEKVIQKYLNPLTPGLCNPANKLPRNCAEALQNNNSCKDGIYLLYVPGFQLEPFNAYCMRDVNNKNAPAWTLIQKRSSNLIDFYRNWKDYKSGFGDLNTNLWLGLDRIHAMTSTQGHELWIKLTDKDDITRYAKYDKFIVGDESEKYPLSVLGKFTGNVEDSLTYHAGQKFTTKDMDNDARDNGNCAKAFKGAWWYDDCHVSNLNGMYGTTKYGEGINWKGWNGYNYTLKYVHMAIRPIKL